MIGHVLSGFLLFLQAKRNNVRRWSASDERQQKLVSQARSATKLVVFSLRNSDAGHFLENMEPPLRGQVQAQGLVVVLAWHNPRLQGLKLVRESLDKPPRKSSRALSSP
jgi:hypothetical protein